MIMGRSGLALAAAFALAATSAHAQRAEENAARAASDAFGTNIGTERVGLYTSTEVRGFNPTTAGNLRLEGVYFDFRTGPPRSMYTSSQVRVGLTAQSYPFPAPTGIVDYTLRPIAAKPTTSVVVQAGPHTGFGIDIDQTPIAGDTFALAWHVNGRHDRETVGDDYTAAGFSVNARWRPIRGVEIRPFVGNFRRQDKLAVQLVFPTGPVLPPVRKAVSTAPDWSRAPLLGYQSGVIVSARLTPVWALLGGVMRNNVNDDGAFADSYLNVGADGVAATRRFTNQLPFHNDSWSGEARLSGVFTTPGLGHVVHASFRARAVERQFGGGAQASFADAPIGLDNAPSVEPTWIYGIQSQEEIKQWTAGLSWQVVRRDLGSVGLGVQQVDYKRLIERPVGQALSTSHDKPLFWNGQASWTPHRRLAVYGAFTRGLEEAPVAPDAAANAQEAPPAIVTKQWEAGVRFTVTERLRLILGWFDIEKPYFNLDQGRIWRDLGVERHAGLEVSLTGEVLPGLNIVGGLVHMKPVVTGEAVDEGLIGEIPVGQARDTARIAFDYRRRPTDPISLEAALNYFGSRPVSSRTFAELGGDQLMAPGYATIDVGFRYRFTAAGHRSTLRFQALNLLDDRHWLVNATGGLGVNISRNLILTLTTDF